MSQYERIKIICFSVLVFALMTVFIILSFLIFYENSEIDIYHRIKQNEFETLSASYAPEIKKDENGCFSYSLKSGYSVFRCNSFINDRPLNSEFKDVNGCQVSYFYSRGNDLVIEKICDGEIQIFEMKRELLLKNS